MVYCVKLKQELPGLKRAPYPGELGQRVYENVSQQGWNMWLEQMTLLINHYGLSLADPRPEPGRSPGDRNTAGRDGRVFLWGGRPGERRLVSPQPGHSSSLKQPSESW
jgi:hypothetical protein